MLIKDWFAIKAVQNIYGSFIWSLFDKKLPGIFILPALLALYALFRSLYFYQKSGNLYLYSLSFILMLASFICVFIDKAVYGGSYDYIYLYQKIYFDIKDVYLTTSIFTMLLSCIYNRNWTEIKQYLRRDPWGKEYLKYEFETWHSLIIKFIKHNGKHE